MFRGHLVQSPAQSRFKQIRLLSAVFVQVLNTSKDSTASLGSLLQYLNTLVLQEKSFPCTKLFLASWPFAVHPWEESDSVFTVFSGQVFVGSNKVYPKPFILSAELIQFPKGLPIHTVLQSLTILVAILLALSCILISFFYWRAQNWT